MRRVVVTGVGVVSPIGIGATSFFENLLAGTAGVKRISIFDPSGFESQIGGEVPAYKIADYVPKSYRKATKVMARDIQLAVMAADDAFKDAGIISKAYSEIPTLVSERFGCNIGAGLISTDINELAQALATAKVDGEFSIAAWGGQSVGGAGGGQGMQQLTPLWLLKYLPNMLACHVTIIHGLKGPSNTVTCADASSHLAIGEAFRTIQRGAADMTICGGAESKLNPMGLLRQTLLKRVNISAGANDGPEAASRPFDADARGSVVGEGGGLLILEEYEHAKSRGAKIYAEVVGFGASQDSYSVTDPDPAGHSYAAAVSKALAEAKLAAADVDLVVPFGMGIPGHDAAELAGLKKALGEHASKVYLSPIKGQTGNLAAGSGVEVATAVLALKHGKVPPAVNTKKTAMPLNVSATVRDANLRVTVSSAYSLGGQNAALVFRAV